MKGIAAVLHSEGWAVSNEVTFDADKFMVEIDGKKYSKNVMTLKLLSIFDTKGQITEGQEVEVIFKADDDKKFAFVGKVKSKGKLLTVIHELLKSERYNQILMKIKA